jgi:hypothetical protein
MWPCLPRGTDLPTYPSSKRGFDADTRPYRAISMIGHIYLCQQHAPITYP